jgi:hypothetical protein
VRGTLDRGFLDEKRTHPNTDTEGPNWDVGPTSVILCHNIIGAVAYVDEVCVESKAAECTKKDPCKILAIGAKFLSSRRIYPCVFRHHNRNFSVRKYSHNLLAH